MAAARSKGTLNPDTPRVKVFGFGKKARRPRTEFRMTPDSEPILVESQVDGLTMLGLGSLAALATEDGDDTEIAPEQVGPLMDQITGLLRKCILGSEWTKFEKQVAQYAVDLEDLMEIVGWLVENVFARPTEPSGS